MSNVSLIDGHIDDDVIKTERMIDNEIIKVLEYCTEGDCRNCPYLPKYNCTDVISRKALDLINRKDAEIERLEKVQVQYVKAYFDEFAERLKNDFRLAQLDIGLTSAVVDELVETMNNEFNTLADFTDLIEAEAVKEFAERFKEKAWIDKTLLGFPYYQITFRMFNNLVKEMVGENK